MNPNYIPADDDKNLLLVHAMEECSEVIKLGCKIQRFGWNSRLPDNPTPNERLLADEIRDLEFSLKRLKRLIRSQ